MFGLLAGWLFWLDCRFSGGYVCVSGGYTGVGGVIGVLDEVSLIEPLIFFSLIEVLLNDFDLAEPIDIQHLKVLELHVDKFQHLALHLLLIVSPNKLTIVGEVFSTQHH